MYQTGGPQSTDSRRTCAEHETKMASEHAFYTPPIPGTWPSSADDQNSFPLRPPPSLDLCRRPFQAVDCILLLSSQRESISLPVYLSTEAWLVCAVFCFVLTCWRVAFIHRRSTVSRGEKRRQSVPLWHTTFPRTSSHMCRGGCGNPWTGKILSTECSSQQ